MMSNYSTCNIYTLAIKSLWGTSSDTFDGYKKLLTLTLTLQLNMVLQKVVLISQSQSQEVL